MNFIQYSDSGNNERMEKAQISAPFEWAPSMAKWIAWLPRTQESRFLAPLKRNRKWCLCSRFAINTKFKITRPPRLSTSYSGKRPIISNSLPKIEIFTASHRNRNNEHFSRIRPYVEICGKYVDIYVKHILWRNILKIWRNMWKIWRNMWGKIWRNIWKYVKNMEKHVEIRKKYGEDTTTCFPFAYTKTWRNYENWQENMKEIRRNMWKIWRNMWLWDLEKRSTERSEVGVVMYTCLPI